MIDFSIVFRYSYINDECNLIGSERLCLSEDDRMGEKQCVKKYSEREELNGKLQELTDEELKQVTGGSIRFYSLR